MPVVEVTGVVGVSPSLRYFRYIASIFLTLHKRLWFDPIVARSWTFKFFGRTKILQNIDQFVYLSNVHFSTALSWNYFYLILQKLLFFTWILQFPQHSAGVHHHWSHLCIYIYSISRATQSVVINNILFFVNGLNNIFTII